MKKLNIRGGKGDSAICNTNADVKDNLYLAINSKWLQETEIPADLSMIGGFEELDIQVRKQLLQDFKKFIVDPEEAPKLKDFDKAIKLYKLAADFNKRDYDGLLPLREDVDKLLKLNNYQELVMKLSELYQFGYILPFELTIDPNMKDTDKYALYFSSPALILPDASSYQDSSADNLLSIFEKQAVNLFKLLGFDGRKSQKYAQEAVIFDKRLAKYAKSQEELNDFAATFNPYPISEFIEETASISMGNFLKELFGDNLPKRIAVMEPKFLKHFKEVVKESNFNELRSWMVVKFIYRNSTYLTQEFRQASFTYPQAIYGIKELSLTTKHAYKIANSVFGEVIGLYYAQTYFGDQAKQDVKEMIQNIVKVFKKRLKANDWLSENTKCEAIKKLDAIDLRIGYPERLSKLYHLLKVDSAQSLYRNMINIEKTTRAFNLSLLFETVDRSLWGMPANIINAGYDPTQNSIVFPAAILQAPFYSIENSRGKNLGGIGAVIAHEITHAFDPNGSKFDEKGNIRNWWSERDFAKFRELTQKEIDLYDGIVCGSFKTNGKQTVGENVADLGGLIAAVELAKTEKVDLKDVFFQWATIWRQKMSVQVRKTLAAFDPHAPSELRANVTVQNIDDFYNIFEITENDGMWLAPANRVYIW